MSYKLEMTLAKIQREVQHEWYTKRFRNLQDATKFSTTRDRSLIIPRYIQIDNGDDTVRFEVNPEWLEAPYEEIIVEREL